ncbi:hypothetical protein KBI23_03665 [bacterium]|nr:hypothetical protein [bacterium]MBP9810033.1 hypothetical protein [bacterium]
MDIILFVLVVFAWVGVVIFRRFHHYSQNRPAIQDAAMLSGYWGSYEPIYEPIYEPSYGPRCEDSNEAAELRMRILERLG